MGNKVAGSKSRPRNSANAMIRKSVSKVHDDVRIKDGVVCMKVYKDKGFEFKPVANYIGVKAVVENIDTGFMFAKLEYHDSHDIKERSISLEDISTRRNVLSLAKFGVDVNESNANAIMRHLRNEIGKAEKQYTHSALGFYTYKDELVFKHNKIITKDKDKDKPSDYTGGITIAPKGSSQVWEKLIEDEILGVPPLELALSIGFSAPIAGLIIDEIGIECPIFHIFGDSTQGKTTAAMVAVSAFGSPNVLEDGLLRTWNLTFNALQATIVGNTGVPIVFDESSMSGKDNFTNLIYIIATGMSKKRADTTGKIQGQDSQDQKVWHTTFIFTGEHSILSKSNENTGLRMRLFEFDNISWTKSASQSEKIKETLLANYGHYGSVFARVLMKLGKARVIALQKKCKSELLAKLSGKATDQRVAGKLSLILVAAKILKKYLKIDINTDSVTELLVNSVLAQSIEGDLGERAYNKILQIAMKNEKKFIKSGDHYDKFIPTSDDRETWGLLEFNGSLLSKIVIMKQDFETQIKASGFEDAKTVLQKLKNLDLLDYEKGKYYRKRKIGHSNVPCYVIKVRPEDAAPTHMQSDEPDKQSSKPSDTYEEVDIDEFSRLE